MREKFLFATAIVLYAAAQFLFEAAQKEHSKRCHNHKDLLEKLKRTRVARAN